MIKPKKVVEIEFTDLTTESSKGLKRNPLISSDKTGYSMVSLVSGVSMIHPVFKRFRDDKKADKTGIRFSQISDLVFIDNSNKAPGRKLPDS